MELVDDPEGEEPAVASIEISGLARRVGVTTSTIRHYDRIGLFPASKRGPGGYRLYDEDSVTRLMLVGRMRATGMSLDEAKTVLTALEDSPSPTGVPVSLDRLEERLRIIREHLLHVRSAERDLAEVVRSLRDARKE